MTPSFGLARDDVSYLATVEACDEHASETDSARPAALLGYLYRNGYGVARDPVEAMRRFESALALEACLPEAVCGLRGLRDRSAAAGCEADCELLAETAAPAEASATSSARDRAYSLLAEMLKAQGPTRLVAEELERAIEEILAQEGELRDRAYEELCTGHIKRAVVTVSLAYQLEQEARRRAKLIAHHEQKVEKDNRARSQVALQTLRPAQRNARADKQVFFEKYTAAVFAAGNCDAEMIERSYEAFEREIAEVRVTELEQRAFELFREHVEAARNDRGISSGWFGNLNLLLD